MLMFLLGLLIGLFIKEVAAYLPIIAQGQINRGLKQLPKETRANFGEKWFAVEAKLPSDLSKVIWGMGCNWLLAPQASKPLMSERVAKLLQFVFFIVYLRAILRDFIKLRFASPRAIKSRWVFLKLIADQAIAVDDPNQLQPLLALADRVHDEASKQTLLVLVEAMRNTKRASKDIAAWPTQTAASG